jgi:hypothetical protein
MGDRLIWSHADMIEATVEWWGRDDIEDADCEVIEGTDGDGRPCLIVVHRPTGKSSEEAADAGRWHLDGTAYGD